MAHQITLSDEEYETLAEFAKDRGQPIEVVVHEVIMKQLAKTISPATLGTYIYPTNEPLTAEEEAEEEEIAQRIGPQKPWLSEMVIEDRGPR